MNWERELKSNITTTKGLEDYFHTESQSFNNDKINSIIEKYPMSIPKYYLSLINPKDANDAIRKLCIPSYLESDANGNLDTSDEKSNTVITGLQHKYKQTALILSTNKCAMYCRHCFRRRLVGLNDNEVEKQFVSIINYIKEHKEINNVLISGGDAFLTRTAKLKHT